jgi:predicted ATP-dependent endonuclease of OLD family
MTTLNDKIEELKAQHPTLRSGNEEDGYTELSADDYDATIKQWAENLVAADAAKAKSEADKAALLARLGLTEDELKTILG